MKKSLNCQGTDKGGDDRKAEPKGLLFGWRNHCIPGLQWGFPESMHAKFHRTAHENICVAVYKTEANKTDFS